MVNRIKNFIPRLLVAFLLLIAVIAGYLLFKDFFEVSALRDILSQKKLLAWPTYFLLQIFQSVSIILPLTPLTIAGGLVFGTSTGFLLSWFGVVAGQMLAFTLSKFLGAHFVQKKIGNLSIPWLQNIVVADHLSVKGVVLLWLAYFSFIVSFDIVAYSLGLTRLKYRWMLIIASIGVIPKLLVLSVIGDTAVFETDKFWFLAGMTMVLGLIVVSTYVFFRGKT